MNDMRWWNQSLPQTLQIGVILSYVTGFFALLDLGGVFRFFASWVGLPGLLVMLFGIAGLVGCVAAGLGISSERKWGWTVGLVLASLVTLSSLIVLLNGQFQAILGLIFDIAWVVALVHPMSREYQRIYFR